MLKLLKHVAMLLPFAALSPHAVLAAGENTIWRASNAEMGDVSWSGFTFSPEISHNTLHLGGSGSALLEDPSGYRVGPNLGYDYQASALLVGVAGEAFYSWMDGRGGSNSLTAYKTEVPYVGALRTRLGYIHGRFMTYATAGLAFAHMTVEDRMSYASASKNMVGWVAGVGVEYAWNKHFKARLQYLHSEYGSYRFGNLPTAQNRISSSMDPVNLHIVFWR